MEVSAIIKGAAGGALVALMLAFFLGWADYQGILSGLALTAVFWVSAAMVFLASGLVSGRLARQGFWLHGGLSALTLALVGSAVAETLGHADGHVVLDLAFALAIGILGGVWGSYLEL